MDTGPIGKAPLGPPKPSREPWPPATSKNTDPTFGEKRFPALDRPRALSGIAAVLGKTLDGEGLQELWTRPSQRKGLAVDPRQTFQVDLAGLASESISGHPPETVPEPEYVILAAPSESLAKVPQAVRSGLCERRHLTPDPLGASCSTGTNLRESLPANLASQHNGPAKKGDLRGP